MKRAKTFTRIFGSALALAVLIAGLSSCGEKKSKSRIKTNEKGEILEISTANQSETGEYDPAGATAYIYFSHQSYALDALIGYTPDGLFTPKTAAFWEISKDLLTYTFHIRENAKWSDGSDVTSYDYKNTAVRALEPENGSWYVDFLFPVKKAQDIFYGKAKMAELGIYTPDAKTIVFELEEPCSYFLDLLVNVPTFFPSNCKYAKDEDKLWDMDPAKNLSNGPWYMAERKVGEYILYKKNPYYWNASEVNVLSLKMRFMDDDQAKAAAYQTGELTMLTTAPSTIAEKYVNSPDLKYAKVPQTNYIMLNPNVAPFDNPKVRKAFALALTRKDIATGVGITCVPTTTFIGPYTKSKVDGTEWKDLQGDLLEENIEEAKKLLAEAGYPEGTGLPKITYTYPSMNYEGDIAQILQQQWKKLGVTVELQALENEVYVATRREKKSQAIRMQWWADYADATSWLMMYVTGNSFNDINYSNPEYDKLVSLANTEIDQAKRLEYMLAAEKIIVSQDTAICPIITNNQANLIPDELEGWWITPLCSINFRSMKVKQ